jgi:hypothetical protein
MVLETLLREDIAREKVIDSIKSAQEMRVDVAQERLGQDLKRDATKAFSATTSTSKNTTNQN